MHVPALVISASSNEIGINLSSPKEEVYAITGGEVISSFEVNGKQAVIVRSFDRHYVYSNLKSTRLIKGDKLEDGEMIGALGAKGSEQHVLHFEVWKYSHETEKAAPLSFEDTKKLAGLPGLN